MRIQPTLRLQPTLFETFPRVWKHPAKATATPASLLKARHLMGSTSGTTEDMSKAQFVEYGVETDSINTAPGVELSEIQKLLTGSVLDVSCDQLHRPQRLQLNSARDVDCSGSTALRRPTHNQETLPLD